MLGLIVVETAIDSCRLPFDVDGLSFWMSSSSAHALSRSLSPPNEILPMRRVDDARLLDAELDAAALELADRLADVEGDRADLRVRHQAARTEHAAELADQAHHVRRGDGRVELEPVLLGIFSMRSSAPTKSAPASCGFLGLVALGENDARAWSCRCRAGRMTAPRTIWSACLGSTPRRIGEVDGLVELRRDLELRDERERLVDRVLLHVAARGLLELLAGRSRSSAGQRSPMRSRIGLRSTTSRPIERAVPSMVRIADSMLVVLRSGSLSSAISRTCFLVTLPTLFLFGSPEPFSIFGRLLEEDRRRRRLGDEGERAVRVDRDDHRDDQVASSALGLRVELLAELHDVDAVLTERGADGRRRIRLAGGD